MMTYNIISADLDKLERRTGSRESTVCGMPVSNEDGTFGGWCHQPSTWAILLRVTHDSDDAYWTHECDKHHALTAPQERLQSIRLHGADD